MNKMRVAVVGCGSVSEKYVPDLQQSSFVDLVAVCDALPERAHRHAEKYGIQHYFDDIDQLLIQVDFDFLVNLTPMPFHGPFNRKALEAGKHVWCEKPLALNLTEAQSLLALAREHNLGIWGAPNTPMSPAFQQMAQQISSGALGKVCVAHGTYGWSGPTWAGTAWYYRKGGGVLFDLGVYNVMTLTGLLGPAKAVSAMAGIAIPQRLVAGETVDVEVEDNIVLTLDHGNAVYSVIQSGFVYAAQREDWTIQVIGTQGAMTMGGYDWEPTNVMLNTRSNAHTPRQWTMANQDQEKYQWYGGARYIAECLAKGERPMLTGEHAVHVLDIMLAALKSAETGCRVPVESTFPWPLVQEEIMKQ